MVKERVTDGKRIAQLLASELDGLGGDLSSVAVTDADPDVEPTTDGAFAYAVTVQRSADNSAQQGTDEPERIAEVYVQPDRARVEFTAAPEPAATAADEANLRVRPKAVQPPRTLVFVEDGAQVKHVVPVVRAVLAHLEETDQTEAEY